MRRRNITWKKRIFALGLAACVAVPAASLDGLTVRADKASEIENQINADKKGLNEINNTISNLSEEQDLLEEEIEDLNAEVVNMMTSIALKEDEITAKEQEITDKQGEINEAQLKYEEAKKREEEQYEAMKVRMRLMYENGNTSVLAMVLESGTIADLVNRVEGIEALYEYDQTKLKEFIATKNEVQALWDQLVLDKSQLETEKSQLEQDRVELQDLKTQLDGKLAKKKQESANYDAEIQKYRQQASAQKKKIQQEEKELKKLKDQQKRAAAAAAASAKTTDQTSTINGATGSELGKKIAQYGCQFVGNPYVMGGTSLTNGADCSGFTYRIYRDFGYSIPRTSYEQRSCGTGVSYENAQPGDLICYDGHVAMYIGGGKIVHASTAKTGIKISNATYRTILAVRRVI